MSGWMVLTQCLLHRTQELTFFPCSTRGWNERLLLSDVSRGVAVLYPSGGKSKAGLLSWSLKAEGVSGFSSLSFLLRPLFH